MRQLAIFLAGILAGILVLACDSNQKVEQSLKKATAYIAGRGGNLYTMMVPTLHHLVREYGLRVDLTARIREIRQRNKQLRNPFLRELDPETVITANDIQRLSGIDRFTATAMHCDRFGLPKNYMAELRQLASQGGYALTHSTLALLLAGWRKCLPNDKFFQEELNLQNRALQRLLQKIQPQSDLGVETMLMLLLLRKNLNLSPDFDRSLIMQMIDAQFPDGSWDQNDHTTVLAIWVLLEARQQGLNGAGEKHE